MENKFKLIQKITGDLTCNNFHCTFSLRVCFDELKPFINEKCPMCGSTLLTQEQYNSYERELELVALKSFANPIPIKLVEQLN